MEMSHWNGKVWYAYGTSITSVEVGKYAQYLEKISGMKLHNRGIGGGGITNLGGYSKGQVKAAIMSLEDGKAEADLITLEVGANEGGAHGYKYDLGDETFCGCLNQCLRYLQENTKAQIVVIVMIGGNGSPPETPSTVRGIPQFEFAETIERVARLNGVPVINVFSEAGFGYARVKAREYQLDNIHLNDLGGKNMGAFVWSKLKDIPLWETE